MRDIRKTLSTSFEHLHDLVFDRYDETDGLAFGAEFTGTIYREGYLFKQSRKMWRFWKTRYFVLRNDGLLYYRSKMDKDGMPLGVIPLKRLSVHLDVINGKGKPMYCLRLGNRHSFKSFYCLCCFSNDERDMWFTSLLTAISQDVVSSYSLSKYCGYRSSSASSTDSALSVSLEQSSSSPSATLERPTSTTMTMSRAASCETVFRGTDSTDQQRHRGRCYTSGVSCRRPSSLASLSELETLSDSQMTSKKSRRYRPNPFRRLKGLSTLDYKGWKGSYIDLSNLSG